MVSSVKLDPELACSSRIIMAAETLVLPFFKQESGICFGWNVYSGEI